MAPTQRIAFLPGAAGERALVARLLAGDELAYRECYETHAPRTYRVLLRIVGDRARAEEVLQETFIAAFKKIAQYRGEAQLGTWITGIGIRRALNFRRDESRRLPVANTDTVDPEAVLPTEEANLASRDLARRVLHLMERLDPARRVALLLHAEGYTAAEIAEMTEAPRGTVLSHISRARAHLLEMLGDEAGAVAKGTAKGSDAERGRVRG